MRAQSGRASVPQTDIAPIDQRRGYTAIRTESNRAARFLIRPCMNGLRMGAIAGRRTCRVSPRTRTSECPNAGLTPGSISGGDLGGPVSVRGRPGRLEDPHRKPAVGLRRGRLSACGPIGVPERGHEPTAVSRPADSRPAPSAANYIASKVSTTWIEAPPPRTGHPFANSTAASSESAFRTL